MAILTVLWTGCKNSDSYPTPSTTVHDTESSAQKTTKGVTPSLPIPPNPKKNPKGNPNPSDMPKQTDRTSDKLPVAPDNEKNDVKNFFPNNEKMLSPIKPGVDITRQTQEEGVTIAGDPAIVTPSRSNSTNITNKNTEISISPRRYAGANKSNNVSTSEHQDTSATDSVEPNLISPEFLKERNMELGRMLEKKMPAESEFSFFSSCDEQSISFRNDSIGTQEHIQDQIDVVAQYCKMQSYEQSESLSNDDAGIQEHIDLLTPSYEQSPSLSNDDTGTKESLNTALDIDSSLNSLKKIFFCNAKKVVQNICRKRTQLEAE